MNRFLTSGVIAAALVLGSCGGGDKDDAGPEATATTEPTDDTTASGENTTLTTRAADPGEFAPVDPCGLVSAEEVSAIIGTTVVTVEQPTVSGGWVCHWEEPGNGYYTVRLTVGGADLYEILKSSQATDLDGLGDEAWSAYVGEIDIGVLAGPYHVLVFFDEPDGMSESDALARGVAFTEAVLESLEA